MKQFFSMLLTMLFLMLMGIAYADTYELDDGTNGYYICEEFDGEMSEYAAQIFADLVWATDEVISGALFEEHYRTRPDMKGRGGALVAVRRDGKILLMSANTNGKGWTAAIETDSFLPPDALFSLNCEPKNHFVHLTLDYQGVSYEIRTSAEGGAYLFRYNWLDDQGNGLNMSCNGGMFVLNRKASNGTDEKLCDAVAVPDRLAAWKADELPRTVESLMAFGQEHPMELEDDEAYTISVNLRESATGKSKTWGEYTAKVEILGQKPGNDAPWYNVRVGNLEGWVSGVYVHGRNTVDKSKLYTLPVMVHPVGRTKVQTPLLDTHGGNVIMQLNTDSYVHVLGERDGYMHVIVPHGELNWQTDWDGTYGFVRKEDIVVGISRTDARYKN